MNFMTQERKADESGWFWRLAIELTDLEVSNIVIEQVNATGKVRNPWSVPLDNAVPVIAPVAKLEKPAKPLGKPTATRKPKAKDKKKSDDET